MATGGFLPAPGDVRTVVLSDAARDLKRRLFDCYPTQRGILQYFPTDVERFRPAPGYAFARAPHEGTLYYERQDWGMTGPRWRALATAALEELELGVRTAARARAGRAADGRP
jgi:hypothetical protein